MNSQKQILFLTAIALIWVSSFGLSAHFSGMRSDEGMMSGCLFDTGPLCAMSFFEHVSGWQSMTTAFLDRTGSGSILLLLSLLLLFAWTLFGRKEDLKEKIILSPRPDRSAELTLYNYLKVQLSSGILSPKIFKLA